MGSNKWGALQVAALKEAAKLYAPSSNWEKISQIVSKVGRKSSEGKSEMALGKGDAVVRCDSLKYISVAYANADFQSSSSGSNLQPCEKNDAVNSLKEICRAYANSDSDEDKDVIP